MERDYAIVEAEVEAYKAGYRDGGNQGFAQGRVSGMLEGIDFLMQQLNILREQLIDEVQKQNGQKQGDKDADN